MSKRTHISDRKRQLESAAIAHALLEKAMRVRADGYFSEVKAKLLMQTIFELGRSKSQLGEMLKALRQQEHWLEQKVQERTKELQLKEARLRFLLETFPTIVYVSKPTLPPTITEVHGIVRKLLGFEAASLLKTKDFWDQCVHPDDRPSLLKAFSELEKKGEVRLTYRLRHADGSWRWFLDHVKLVREVDGKAKEIIGCMADITDRVLEEQARLKAAKRLIAHRQALFELATCEASCLEEAFALLTEKASKVMRVQRCSVWRIEEDGQVLRCWDLFDRSSRQHYRDEILSMADYPSYFSTLQHSDIVDADDAASDPRTREFAKGYLRVHRIGAMLDAAIRKKGKLEGVVCFEHVGGARHWSNEEKVFAVDFARQAALMLQEEEQRKAEHKIWRLAHMDLLTGLPNRATFMDRLGIVLAYAQRRNRSFAVLYLDLDGFKEINDAMGHDAGDRVLKQVGERLRSCIRGEDTVARMGGDEFLFLLPDAADAKACAHVAEKILQVISQPISIEEGTFRIGASIGIAVYPKNGTDAESLIHHADEAMYQAKRSGRNRYCFA